MDEIWHAGDWGDYNVCEKIKSINTTRGVYGNIDGQVVRKEYKKDLRFSIEGITVLMTHIGGYPPRYNKRTKPLIENDKPDLFICGHSHICKVVRDKRLDVLHFNPGAIGNKGFHKKRTMLTFRVDLGRIFGVKVLEYDRIYK